ncbi:hypothetical protein SAMN04488024_102657 [Pedobacter soli]|uniref:RNA polymerase, alpha chain C terminal domain n=1 Tax=Pedobacter soli TaxID=390242 RepID=A0A1G6NEX9_9SPHI|nr:hypothetical protein SAMN04488024_102657 [Pedobacter soli]
MEKEDILDIPIEKLGFSSNFRRACDTMNVSTLNDITSVLPEQLINKKGFSYSWLGELSAYLDKKGLLHLLQRP